MERRSRASWSIAVFGVSALILGLVLWFLWKPHEVVPPPTPELDLRIPRALDGRRVAPEDASSRLVAIVMENMVDGRPLSGIREAPLVFEAPVEGRITRLLAIFPLTDIPEEVGPVRSLRPYFLTWAEELNAVLLHVGGSPEALEKAIVSSLARLNQFYDHQYFWRSEERSAPFNVYTSRTLIERALEKKGIAREDILDPWIFSDSIPEGGKGATSVRLPYRLPEHDLSWRWNGEKNAWERFIDGIPDVDRIGDILTAENVVVQETAVRILDAIGRRHIQTNGEGRAFLFRNGTVVDGTWRKNAGERTRFFQTTGEEFSFARGTTWVNVVPKNFSIDINH